MSPHGPMPFPRFAWNSSITRVFQSATPWQTRSKTALFPCPPPSECLGAIHYWITTNYCPAEETASFKGEKKRGRERKPAPRAANLWWRRRESNPRPGAARAQRLRVCLRDWVSRSDAPLSRIIRTPARWHSPLPSRARPSASSRLVASIPDRRRSRMDVRGYLGRVSVPIGIGGYAPLRSFTRARATSTRSFASACPVETVRPH